MDDFLSAISMVCFFWGIVLFVVMVKLINDGDRNATITDMSAAIWICAAGLFAIASRI